MVVDDGADFGSDMAYGYEEDFVGRCPACAPLDGDIGALGERRGKVESKY